MFLSEVTVLLTCAGGVISPSQVGSFRVNPEGRSIRVIGTDMTVPCVAQYLTDKFYQVPYGSAPNYVDKIMDICRKESVDVIFPASHEEAIALTSERAAIERSGTKIAVSRRDVLELAFNKALAYRKLRDSGLPCPDFRVVRNLVEFEDAAAELGIGDRKVVMKPVLTRGGRGARVLTKGGMAGSLLGEKPGYLETGYGEIVRTLSQLEERDFPELVLMEYLPGPIYSVDFLTKDGKALIVVPKVRIVGNASQTIVGMVKRNKDVEEAISSISEAFGFDYNVNIEMGCNEAGVALPFDFNPRMAASVAFCSAAGANLVYYALKLALGENVPKVEVKDGVMMLRYFKELYV